MNSNVRVLRNTTWNVSSTLTKKWVDDSPELVFVYHPADITDHLVYLRHCVVYAHTRKTRIAASSLKSQKPHSFRRHYITCFVFIEHYQRMFGIWRNNVFVIRIYTNMYVEIRQKRSIEFTSNWTRFLCSWAPSGTAATVGRHHRLFYRHTGTHIPGARYEIEFEKNCWAEKWAMQYANMAFVILLPA